MKDRSGVPGTRKFQRLIHLGSYSAILAIALGGPPTLIKASAGDVEARTLQTFRNCAVGSRKACVVDGDTIWMNGQKVRIADIDTPEINEPKCASELALGTRATERLLELINSGPFEVHAWPQRDEDRYGRKLRVLVRNGRSLGNILVSEGLARTWTGRREPWC
ncbi:MULTISPECIES: thermonuclease family protein [unclassified Rhizobium]|uniref:thermonuclease family protein n=1 Tax=unclassified Rhizobium TaxID=2613769 RepID=UPI0009EBB288|nr:MULTISPECIES: thermonuclease family protein [unclassified Rhizobium]